MRIIRKTECVWFYYYLRHGKWMIFELTETSLFPDMEKLLRIKRVPNKIVLAD